MKWRVVVELIGADGAICAHEVGGGGAPGADADVGVSAARQRPHGGDNPATNTARRREAGERSRRGADGDTIGGGEIDRAVHGRWSREIGS